MQKCTLPSFWWYPGQALCIRKHNITKRVFDVFLIVLCFSTFSNEVASHARLISLLDTKHSPTWRSDKTPSSYAIWAIVLLSGNGDTVIFVNVLTFHLVRNYLRDAVNGHLVHEHVVYDFSSLQWICLACFCVNRWFFFFTSTLQVIYLQGHLCNLTFQLIKTPNQHYTIQWFM